MSKNLIQNQGLLGQGKTLYQASITHIAQEYIKILANSYLLVAELSLWIYYIFSRE